LQCSLAYVHTGSFVDVGRRCHLAQHLASSHFQTSYLALAVVIKQEIEFARDVSITISWLTAAAVLIFYEHVVTFSQEVQSFWTNKISGATIIFLLNRYTLVVFGIVLLLQNLVWTTPLRLGFLPIRFNSVC